MSSSSPFGPTQPPAPATTPFSSGGTGTSLFGGGAQNQSPATPSPAGGGASAFGGRNPRDMLTAFYQQYNPSKLAEVDRLLVKYQGKEEQMFRNLAKKYNLNPSVFGLSATPSFGSTPVGGPGGFGGGPPPLSSGFGQPSSLGGGPAFGGGSAATPFGGGFGHTSTLGGGGFGAGAVATSTPAPSFGAAASTPSPSTFGNASGGAFGSGASSGPTSFGSLAQSSGSGGFGSLAQSSGRGGFGSPGTPAPFGTATPFGAPRR